MTQNTNLNVSPYFDDFSESKNYKKVLFKPGFPVQSRELTTLQSILQNQIEKFGQYFFKEGSMVIPGGVSFDISYPAVKLDPFFLNIPVKEYTKVLADGGIKIKGETSGVTAIVVNRLTETESTDGVDTIYVKYVSNGTNGEQDKFADGENLITLSDINFSVSSIEANSTFAKCIDTNATSTGCSASVSEGIYFIRGYFVNVPTSTVILDQYTNSPSYKIGLSIKEEIVSASKANSDLFDNAVGFANESAPGADRFKISTTLIKKALTDSTDQNFVELIRIKDGILENIVNTTDLNIFERELARRTYDESGDYYTKPFTLDIRESLNDRISNRGLYFENEVTQNGNTPSDEIYTIQVSPGKAYVRGYEIDKIGTTGIDSLKPRTTRKKETQFVPVNAGNVVTLNNVSNVPKVGFGTDLVVLHDRRIQGTGASAALVSGDKEIGLARAYDFNQKFQVGVSTEKFDLRLYDVQTFTEITVGTAITAAKDSYVKGKFSGSTGFLRAALSNQSNIVLYNTKGDFQINEPLEVNGVSIGRNVGVSTDFEFSDVKSVSSAVGGGELFLANTELSGEVRPFNVGDEFNVTSVSGSGLNQTGTMTCGGVADFRTLVKVGDIISYVISSQTLPILNRVSAVAKDSITLFATTSVAGVSVGTVVAGTPQSPKIVVPELRQGNFPGYLLPISNQFISSVNLLKSDYFVRKQITKSGITTGSFTFNISDLGDNDLTFEPYTEVDYSLVFQNGQRETIRLPQTSFNAAKTTFTIDGITQAGTGTLTALCKRNKLTSKDKTINRCNSIIINRSKFSGAGTGSLVGVGTLTSFLDGLAFSEVYGTRVQDEEISLNLPDIHRVLAVFESNDATNPQLPQITVSSQTDTFTNNVVVGEQFVGATSGAVGRVVTVTGGQQVNFVYENDKVFQIGENITLKDSGIVSQISAIIIGDRNLLSSYEVDTGQRLEFVDYGRIIRKKDIIAPARRLQIIFDNYVNDESSGTIETVNSYNGLDYSKEVPLIGATRASDYIDYRPRVGAYNTSSTISPFAFLSRNFTNSSSETLVSNKAIRLDYNYYLGRIDRLYLTKNGIFELKKGEPSEFPKAPLPNDEAFEVAIISMSPYTVNATLNSQVTLIPHKRFTMKDIGSLENRIRSLEEYTTLNLLETDTNNLSIKDPNTGLDKFKSGFFVDNFRSHKSHNLTGDSNFDIDFTKAELRPRTTERNAALGFETNSTKASPTTADYSVVDDFASPNITRNGSVLTLKFDEVEFIDQSDATRVENVNPFLVTSYVGSIELNPATDFWIEEIPLATPDIVKIDSIYEGLSEVLGVGENGGMAASIFNSSETTWTGSETQLTNEIVNQTSSSTQIGNNIVTTSSHDIKQTQTITEKGVETTFGLEVTPKNEQFSLGEKVIDINVLYNVRSRNIEVVGKKLKPNTRYYVFMENVNLTGFCVPKLLPITMVRGSFAVGDIVESGTAIQVLGQPEIKFRAAQSNHKFGDFKSPTKTFSTEPYNNTSLTSAYSSTSTTLNVDTSDLADFVKPDRIGYVTPGMVLVNSTGTAEAEVDSIKLISDEGGNLIFSLHIPDPKIESNHKFTTGANTIRLTSSPTNDLSLLPGEVSAETVYNATGFSQTTQEQILSFKTAEIEEVQIGEQPVSKVSVSESIIESVISVTSQPIPNPDPLAQSFTVPRKTKSADGTIISSDGIFITSGEVFVRTKDDTLPLNVSIRTMQNGVPTKTIVPFGEVDVDPLDITTSDDGSIGTKFTFKSPVYLQSEYDYALVLSAQTQAYNVFVTRMGEVDLLTKKLNDKQPVLGSLFKSQNASTWTPSQFEDLKFKLNKAKFVTNSSGTILLNNTNLPLGKILKENPVESFSQTQFVSIATTNRAFTLGDRIIQANGGINDEGRISTFGGPALNLSSIALSGIGLTSVSGVSTYTGIGFTALTGVGDTITATVTVTGTDVSNIVVTDGGKGFVSGDIVVANQVGFIGSAAKATVGIGTLTNLLVIDNVTRPFRTGVVMTHFSNNASAADHVGTISAPISVPNDPIKDGFTMKINHKNHGMHSSQNKVKIVDFQSDISPVLLSDAINDDTTNFVVSDISILENFEGSQVSTANTGYLKIGKEIISYTGFATATKQITVGARAVGGSLKSNHKQNDLVSTYQFNDVSLLKINTTHDIDTRTKTFDSYFVKIADTNKSFKSTKRGGGGNLKISQNIPFEIVNPQVTSVLPTGATLSGRVKTTSGTSINGSEASFNDEGFVNVALNKNNELDTPRIIASETNEFNLLGNTRSFGLELTLNSNNENISPFIDLSRLNVILHSNLVDKPITDFENNSIVRIPGLDPHHAVYETKKIDLEFPSNGLFIKFDGHRDEEADIKVLFKLFRNDSSNDGQVYVPFNKNGSSDKFVKPNIKNNTFSEYKFTADNLPQFNGFMIKVIMTSTNQAKPPRIKNFRSIALRTFQGE